MNVKKRLVHDIEEGMKNYYHMEDRLDEVKSRMTFVKKTDEQIELENIKSHNFIFRKPCFILTSIIAGLVLIGGSTGITCLIKNQQSYENDSLYHESILVSNLFIYNNFSEYSKSNFYSISLSQDKYLFNFIDIQSPENSIMLSQFYTKLSNFNISINYKNNDYQKTLTYTENRIDVLNDEQFPINSGDIVKGSIFIDNQLVKEITLNF